MPLRGFLLHSGGMSDFGTGKLMIKEAEASVFRENPYK